MDKKKILLSLAAITGAIGGVKADSKINLNSEGDNLRSNQLTFKKILKNHQKIKMDSLMFSLHYIKESYLDFESCFKIN